MNVVLLQGVLSSEPRQRSLPSGSLLVNWEVTTELLGVKHSVPVSWFDPPKSVRLIQVGDEVTVLGSVRRRFYRTGSQTVSSTEVLGERGARTRRAKQVERIHSEVLDRVDPAGLLMGPI